ncbi:hypothetical protein C8T65DRAFT_155621 [Cerioporus squamosus]|nr:hypothetical protein C8T65DRAFT_155621 [Cerioporus squamosus]
MSLSGSTRPNLAARPSSSSGLWGHLMRSTVSQVPTSSAASSTTLGRHGAPLAPLDKAGASTRILLHDTQAHLEKFTERVGQLATGFENAKQELSTVQKLYQDEYEQLTDRMIGLANRCQTELQKAIGSPAQTMEVREVSKDLSAFATRLEALDKKIDTLNVLNQTQSQALQTIQDQQGQILSALLPVLPLLQSVPLHIENARNQVKDSISELQRRVSAREVLPVPSVLVPKTMSQSGTREPSRSSSDPVSAATSPVGRKKRRLDEVSDPSSDPFQAVPELALAPMATPASVEVPSPEIPLSSLRSRLSRKNTLRSPLADLLPTNHRFATTTDVKKSLLFNQAHAAVTQAGLTTAPSVSGSLCTPTRGRTLTALPQISGPTFNTTTPPGPPGGSKSLLPSVRRTPQSRRSSRHLANAAKVHVAHGTPVLPVLGRSSTAQPSPANGHYLHRTATARLDTAKGNTTGLVARSDMRPPSVPPSAGKPMSLKDRRALLSLSEDVARTEGKRFIPLDDEDDEDIELVE